MPQRDDEDFVMRSIVDVVDVSSCSSEEQSAKVGVLRIFRVLSRVRLRKKQIERTIELVVE